jgi:hypothetical protein
MTRAELLLELARHPVPVSLNGSPALDVTPAMAARLATQEDVEVRLLDLTVIPGALRRHFAADGHMVVEGS